ncbi:SKP1-like protein 11 [Capsicum baccatum]|uniref:SKP1-like protein n=1 Tax=Capsicum baccatum TaxID=33114 RepID=A0A2G2VA77_CAPBA|nr:SKP1-like protein 11 [Capsicum baccatum]
MASSSEKPKSKILILKSCDEDEFEIDESIAIQSGTIKNMMEEDYTHIPLPNVNTQTLIKIIEYMKKHAEKSDSNEEDIKTFDKDFVKMKFTEVFGLILAANYLNINGLMDLLCQSVADKIKNKSVKAVRKIFNITNDFTPEEEEKVYEEHKWAHEEGKEHIDESLD